MWRDGAWSVERPESGPARGPTSHGKQAVSWRPGKARAADRRHGGGKGPTARSGGGAFSVSVTLPSRWGRAISRARVGLMEFEPDRGRRNTQQRHDHEKEGTHASSRDAPRRRAAVRRRTGRGSRFDVARLGRTARFAGIAATIRRLHRSAPPRDGSVTSRQPGAVVSTRQIDRESDRRERAVARKDRAGDWMRGSGGRMGRIRIADHDPLIRGNVRPYRQRWGVSAIGAAPRSPKRSAS